MISSSFAGLHFCVMGWQLVVGSPYHCCYFLKASHTNREHQHRISLLFSDISVCGSAYVCILEHHFYFIFIISSFFLHPCCAFSIFCSKIKMFLVFIKIFWCSIPAFCFSSLSLWRIFDEHKVIFCYLVQTKLTFTFILFCLERSM